MKLQTFLNKHKKKVELGEILCPLVSESKRGPYLGRNHPCQTYWSNTSGPEGESLGRFLRSQNAKNYFKDEFWKDYGSGWEFLALLSLLNLWSNSLANIEFGRTANLFSNEVDKFKLGSLFSSNENVIFVKSENESGAISSISSHTGDSWKLWLCKRDRNCESGNSIKLSLTPTGFCLVDAVCFDSTVDGRALGKLKGRWETLHSSTGLWTKLYQQTGGLSTTQILFVFLVVAGFNSPEDVVVSVQEPSERGESDIQANVREEIKRDILERIINLTI